jgi:hypothetical protein
VLADVEQEQLVLSGCGGLRVQGRLVSSGPAGPGRVRRELA